MPTRSRSGIRRDSGFAATLATIRFGDLPGTGQLAGRDAQGGGERPNGARRRRRAAGFQARDGQGVDARLTRELGLSQKALQSKAAEIVRECHGWLLNSVYDLVSLMRD